MIQTTWNLRSPLFYFIILALADENIYDDFSQNVELLLKPLNLHPVQSKTILDKFAAVGILQVITPLLVCATGSKESLVTLSWFS